ncbi:hypothetical protein J7I92_01920 [Arthrobacter sp. ISL-72]|nr:hypothetical protein [Arthrobacter sp. ISL-72]
MPHTGIEGLLIKRNDQPYAGGVRNWWKLKHRETVEVVCAAVIGPIHMPREIVAGLPIGGKLRIVGRSAPLTTAASRALARWLRPAAPRHPWPTTVKGTYRHFRLRNSRLCSTYGNSPGPLEATVRVREGAPGEASTWPHCGT